MKINIFNTISNILYILLIFIVIATVNTNAKFLNDSVLNMVVHAVEVVLSVFLLIVIMKFKRNYYIKIITMYTFFIIVLILLKIHSFGQLIVARWYLLPLILIFLFSLVPYTKIIYKLTKKKNEIYLAMLLVFLLFMFQHDNLGQRVIKSTMFEGYAQLGSSLFAFFLIFLFYAHYFIMEKNVFYMITSILAVIGTIILLFFSGVKTYLFFSILILILNFIRSFIFTLKNKKIIIGLFSLILLSLLFIQFIPKHIYENLQSIIDLVFSTKVLTFSGRLPDFFGSNQFIMTEHDDAGSVAEYWIGIIAKNPLGYGWYSNVGDLPPFDGAIWEIGYTSGVISIILFIALFFLILYKSYFIYKKNKTFNTFNVYLINIVFLVLFIVAEPFNGLFLPFMYTLLVFFVEYKYKGII